MPKKAKPIVPFFSVRGDFTDSLENFCQQSMMLLQAIETALDLDQIGERVKPVITERVKAFRAALIGEDDAET